jgi:glycosyltransferase 2 family protein
VRLGAKTAPVAKRAFKALFFPAVLALAGFLIWRITRQYGLDEVLESVGAIPEPAPAGVRLRRLELSLPHRLRLAGGALCRPPAALAQDGPGLLQRPVDRTQHRRCGAEQRGHPLSLLLALGLSGSECIKVILFCGLTVGLGLMILGGVALLLSPGLASEYTRLPRSVVLLVGGVCLGLAAAYLVLSIFDWRPVRIGKYSSRSRRSTWRSVRRSSAR